MFFTHFTATFDKSNLKVFFNYSRLDFKISMENLTIRPNDSLKFVDEMTY